MNPVFECLRNLAAAVGHALTRYMHELLELMFSAGLSEAFVQALVDLSRFIPPLLPLIQGNLCIVLISGSTYCECVHT